MTRTFLAPLLLLLALAPGPARETRLDVCLSTQLRRTLDHMAHEVQTRRLARNEETRAPGRGRILDALATLLGLTPYPVELPERALLVDVLRSLETRAPDVAAQLAARLGAHDGDRARGDADA